jgi:hypothetical protein
VGTPQKASRPRRSASFHREVRHRARPHPAAPVTSGNAPVCGGRSGRAPGLSLVHQATVDKRTRRSGTRSPRTAGMRPTGRPRRGCRRGPSGPPRSIPAGPACRACRRSSRHAQARAGQEADLLHAGGPPQISGAGICHRVTACIATYEHPPSTHRSAPTVIVEYRSWRTAPVRNPWDLHR